MFTKNLILKNWAWLPRDYRGFFFVHGLSFNYTLRNLTPHFELVILSTNLTSDTTFQVPAEVFLCKWIMCQLKWLSAMPRFEIPYAEIDAVMHPSNCLTLHKETMWDTELDEQTVTTGQSTHEINRLGCTNNKSLFSFFCYTHSPYALVLHTHSTHPLYAPTLRTHSTHSLYALALHTVALVSSCSEGQLQLRGLKVSGDLDIQQLPILMVMCQSWWCCPGLHRCHPQETSQRSWHTWCIRTWIHFTLATTFDCKQNASANFSVKALG